MKLPLILILAPLIGIVAFYLLGSISEIIAKYTKLIYDFIQRYKTYADCFSPTKKERRRNLFKFYGLYYLLGWLVVGFYYLVVYFLDYN